MSSSPLGRAKGRRIRYRLFAHREFYRSFAGCRNFLLNLPSLPYAIRINRRPGFPGQRFGLRPPTTEFVDREFTEENYSRVTGKPEN